MIGALAIQAGVVWVGWHARRGRLRAFDLAGRALGPAVELGSSAAGTTAVSGIDVDACRRVWVADEVGGSLQRRSAFGAVQLDLRRRPDSPAGELGDLVAPVAVSVDPDSDGARVWVGMGGEGRGRVQLVSEGGEWLWRLRSLGEPTASFHGVRRVRALGRWLYVGELRRGRIQVFRDGQFAYAIPLRVPREHGAVLAGLAPLPGERCAVAIAGAHSAVLVLDSSGSVLRTLGAEGAGAGAVEHASDVAASLGESDRDTKLAVLDRDGARLQVFDLEGGLCGSLEELAG